MSNEFNPNVPIYLQMMEMIKKDIISGKKSPGDRMDSVRELAQNFGVNPNTMQRALSELEREGFLYSERTTGRFITKDVELIKNARDEIAKIQINEFIKEMKSIGFTIEEVMDIIKQSMGKVGERQ